MHQPNFKQAPPARSKTLRRSPATTKKSSAVGTNPLQPQIRQLPDHQPAPLWLKSLKIGQKISMVLCVSVFGLSSIVYGYTMHTQTTWRSQQDQWRRWQNQERELGVTNENLKQSEAKAAEDQKSGLVELKPHLAVFIHSAPPRSPKQLPNPPQSSQPTPTSKIPAGY